MMLSALARTVFPVSLFTVVGSLALAANPLETDQYLRRFHETPRQVMNEPLARIDGSGAVVATPLAPPRAAILAAKDEVRLKLLGLQRAHGPSTFALADSKNQVTSFLYQSNIVRSPLEMERAGLTQVTLPTPPWSDSFWPMQKGLIGRRWADPAYPDSKNWVDNYAYIQSNPADLNISDSLSPAEKYDLLVGDGNFSLTNANWDAGKYYFEKDGHVPAWMGICHGWSPAAFMTPVPLRSVVAQSLGGHMITFYPSDIKALAAQAWGEAPPRMNVVGARCLVTDPKEDSVGRVLDDGCFDVNPGTWHMAIVNQMGVAKRSFVFDATYDAQVWNYPIYAYKYQYFNPQTLNVSNKLSGAVVRMADFSIDKFKSYRSPDSKYVVGVAMDVTYVIPTLPSMKAVTASAYHTVKYVYDLELDAKGEIIGGEWYSNFHPDFIWNFPEGGRTLSSAEKRLGQPLVWDGSGPVSTEILSAARESSPKRQPLAVIVETLVRLSQSQ